MSLRTFWFGNYKFWSYCDLIIATKQISQIEWKRCNFMPLLTFNQWREEIQTVPILYNFCGTCSHYVIFFIPEKGKGERKKREGGKKKEMGEKGVFPISFEEIFFPPSLFRERKIWRNWDLFRKSYTKLGQFVFPPI